MIEGPFTISNGASVTGNGVTLYFTCSGYPAQTNDSSCPSGGGTGEYFSLIGNGTSTLAAPTTPGDPYANLLMFYDRNDTGNYAGTGCGTDFIDNGGVLNTTGTIYAKAAQLCIDGGGAALNSLFVVGELAIANGGSVSANVIPSQQISLGAHVTSLIG